jgi:hypothetical protein
MGQWGYFYIVGEVQNVGDQYAHYVEISPINYYDGEGAVIIGASDNASGGSVSLSFLPPGRKSPFLISYYNYTPVSDYSLAVVDFSSYEWSTDRKKLNITSHSSSIVEGEMIISGEVAHIDGSSASGVKVLATCYDEHGTVVEMGGQSLIHWDAGQTGAFEITLDDNVPLITSYELTTASSFLDMIPEFNSLLFTLLVLSLISIAFFLSKRKVIQKFTPLPK